MPSGYKSNKHTKPEKGYKNDRAAVLYIVIRGRKKDDQKLNRMKDQVLH